MYKQIISRLRVSRFRTMNPNEAAIFIIPFDLGVHSYIDHVNGIGRLAAPHGRFFVHMICNTIIVSF
jgi:hypothetical protein